MNYNNVKDFQFLMKMYNSIQQILIGNKLVLTR